MTTKQIRTLAIELLDDENGINAKGYDLLEDLLNETGNSDIVNAVDAQNGRFFLGEEVAEQFRNDLTNLTKSINLNL